MGKKNKKPSSNVLSTFRKALGAPFHTQAQVTRLEAAKAKCKRREAVKVQRRRRREASAQVHANAGGFQKSGTA